MADILEPSVLDVTGIMLHEGQQKIPQHKAMETNFYIRYLVFKKRREKRTKKKRRILQIRRHFWATDLQINGLDSTKTAVTHNRISITFLPPTGRFWLFQLINKSIWQSSLFLTYWKCTQGFPKTFLIQAQYYQRAHGTQMLFAEVFLFPAV